MQHLTIDPVIEALHDPDTGRPHIIRGCLEWTITSRARTGGLIYYRDIVKDRRDVGANTLMIGTMLSWGGTMANLDSYWWGNLTDCIAIAEEEKVRIVPIIFADTKTIMPDPGRIKAHYDQFCAHMAPHDNVDMLLVANQPGHPSQCDWIRQAGNVRSLFDRNTHASHQLIGLDNPHEEANPILPAAHWSGYCASRTLRKYQSIGASGWYVKNGWPEDPAHWGGTHGLVYHTEMPRIEETNEWNNTLVWKDIARSQGFQGVVGMNMYSRAGVTGDRLSGGIKNCYVEGLGNIFFPDQMSR